MMQSTKIENEKIKAKHFSLLLRPQTQLQFKASRVSRASSKKAQNRLQKMEIGCKKSSEKNSHIAKAETSTTITTQE